MHMQAAVRWPKQERGKKATWLHVQFDSVESVAEACQLSGQQMMGRELLVEPGGAEGAMTDKPLNMGQAVKDCWFCLSNEQVRNFSAFGIQPVARMCTGSCLPYSCAHLSLAFCSIDGYCIIAQFWG